MADGTINRAAWYIQGKYDGIDEFAKDLKEELTESSVINKRLTEAQIEVVIGCIDYVAEMTKVK